MDEITAAALDRLADTLDNRGLLTIAVTSRGAQVRWENPLATDLKFKAPGGYLYSLGPLLNPILNDLLPDPEPGQREEIVENIRVEIMAVGRRGAMKGDIAEPPSRPV